MSDKLDSRIPDIFSTDTASEAAVTPPPGQLVVSRVGGGLLPKGWMFALDQPAEGLVLTSGGNLKLKGWVLDPRGPVADIRVVRESDGQEAGRLQTGLAREGVAAAHPKLAHAATCGFRGGVAISQPGRYRIEVTGPSAARAPVFRLSLRDSATPPTKLMFMHIAKTAGTSANRFFADSAGADRCAFHIESDPRWRDPARLRELEAIAVISGHITYRAFSHYLDLGEYLKVTALRMPLDHVISHLAYIRRLADPSQRSRLLRHSPAIRAFAAKLAATDFADGTAVKGLVAGLVAAELALVDNVQVRYLSSVASGERVQQSHLQSARQALIHFDHVGLTEQMAGFLSGIASRMNWPQPRTIPQENRNPERYGLDASNAELRVALKPLITYDQSLYRYARKIFIDGNDALARRFRKKAPAASSAAVASAPRTKPRVRTA